MKNRVVGIIVIGIAALIGFIVFSFNRALTTIVNTACTHGTSCPMWGTIKFQTNVGIGIMAFIVVIGLYMIFFGQEEKVITKIRIKKQPEPKKNNKIQNNLEGDEKTIYSELIKADGTIFQSELVEKTNFSKVKVTRILDKLEGKGIIERKRRGMTNVVILRH